MLLPVFKMCISEVEISIIQKKKKRKRLTCLGQESVPDLKMTKNSCSLIKVGWYTIGKHMAKRFQKVQKILFFLTQFLPYSKAATRPNCVVCLWKVSNTVDWSWLECDEHVSIQLVLCIFFSSSQNGSNPGSLLADGRSYRIGNSDIPHQLPAPSKLRVSRFCLTF